MSKSEQKDIAEKIYLGILKAQKDLFEYKAKLGLNVVITDSNGMPVEIPAKNILNGPSTLSEKP